MKASITHLDQLMDALSKETGFGFEPQGLKDMSEAIGLKEKYLYEYIHRKKEKARAAGETIISVQPVKLDIMAKHLGFPSYQAFVTSVDKPIDPILLSLAGNYYSYVRRNDEKGFILRSPVRIFQADGKLLWKLKGPMRVYMGEIKLKHGCLFVLMEEEGGKQMHHIYKIGTMSSPQVLQGIFSGVSTNFDPIGGRTVLVRHEVPFENLLHKEGQLNEFNESAIAVEKAISVYLNDYATNNLKINRVVKFGEADIA